MPSTPVTPAGRGQGRVVILDDHVLFAETLELALSLEGYDVRRVPLPGEGGSLTTTGASMVRMQPRIALLDLDLGSIGTAMDLIAPLARAGVAVIVVTGSIDRGSWGECLHHGARKVLSKSEPLNEILAVVRKVNRGVPVMAPGERDVLLRQWRQARQETHDLRQRLAKLTARERDVFGHLVLGRTVSEIASISFVSEGTVRTQVRSILAKLEVQSQIAAVGIAHRTGWQPPMTS